MPSSLASIRNLFGTLPVAAIVVSLVIGVLFLVRQTRERDPLIDLKLFGNPRFSGSIGSRLANWAGRPVPRCCRTRTRRSSKACTRPPGRPPGSRCWPRWCEYRPFVLCHYRSRPGQ
jgi:hypothetical protein